MAWTIRFDSRAAKELARLDRSVQRQLIQYLETRVAIAENPEVLGKALTGRLAGLRRYRVKDHRIVCRVESDSVLVVVLVVGHREDVYERPVSIA